jgi:DNA polymerase-3 subunit beta
MKFEMERENLIEGLTAVKGAVGNAKTFWSTSNVLLQTGEGRVVFTANNMNDVAEAAMAAQVAVAGSITVAFAPLYEWVKLAGDGSVVLEILEDGSNHLRVTAGRSVAKFVTSPASDFPPTPSFPTEATLTLEAEDFQRWVTQGAYAGAKDDTRPTMKAALVKAVPVAGSGESWEARMFTTDGFRLAYSGLAVEGLAEGFEWLIPANFLQMIVGQAGKWTTQVKLTVEKEGSMVFADMGGVRFAAHMLEGSYPNVEAVIPSIGDGTVVTVNTAELVSAIQAATVFTEDNTQVLLSLICGGGDEPTKVLLQTESSAVGGGKNLLDARWVRGVSMDITVNGKYLLQAAKASKCENLTLQVTSPHQPLMTYPSFEVGGIKEECKAVIMPMHPTNR